MEKVRIIETFKTIEKHNRISGHSWTEQGKATGYEVAGGRFQRTKHLTLKGAEKERKTRIMMLRHHPILRKPL